MIEVERWRREKACRSVRVYWLFTVRGGRQAIQRVAAGSRREAVIGNVDTGFRSPPSPLRSRHQAVGTFLLDKGFLSRPLLPGGAPARGRSLRASQALRNEWALRLRLDCCVVAGFGRWTSVLLVLPQASKGAGECLPRSSAAMVRVWMLGGGFWPRWQRMCQGRAIKARCDRLRRVEFAACC